MAASDILRSRDGRMLTVRPVADADAPVLQDYFHRLSEASRYRRMLGATRELPPRELDRVLHGDRDHLAMIVTREHPGFQEIVAEARLAHDPATDEVEISLSVGDAWQRNGVGGALFDNLQALAAGFGTVVMYGDTLRTNDGMLALARNRGFKLMPTPGDWRLLRFHKPVGPELPAAQQIAIWNGSVTRKLAAHGVGSAVSVPGRTTG